MLQRHRHRAFKRREVADVERDRARSLRLADTEYRLRALCGLWTCQHYIGAYRTALGLAQRFSDLAATGADLADLLIADRMMGSSLHIWETRALQGVISSVCSIAMSDLATRFATGQSTTAGRAPLVTALADSSVKPPAKTANLRRITRNGSESSS
jgi:hypothetical protein